MSDFISVRGKCTNVNYTAYGIQLTMFPEGADPEKDYPRTLTTFDKSLAEVLEEFSHLPFTEIPVYFYPVHVYAKAFIKDGQTRAFPIFNIEKEFDITPQL